MALAIVADDFRALAVGVKMAVNGAVNLIIKARPSAVALELVGGSIQWRIALAADVRARLLVVRVLADEGTFGTFLEDHERFFPREFVESGTLFVFHGNLRRRAADGG
jgi:hypothetical protein